MKKNYFFLILIFFLLLSMFVLVINYHIFTVLKSLLWSIVTIILISYGIYYSIKYKFIHLEFKNVFKYLLKKNDNVSNFEALSLSLGAKIGVGSISGIALSIYLGGPGTIFWIWITSIIISIITYLEGYLGNNLNKKNNNINIGGPSYYIDQYLNNKKVAILFSFISLITFVFGFISIQSNTIIKSINYSLNINNITIIIILVFFTSIIIFKNLKKIINISSKIVPFMLIFYIFIGVIIIILNYYKIFDILFLIINDAFNFKTGIFGILTTFIIGLQRGIFATEVGIGTSSIASSMVEGNPKEQAICQSFGVNFTSLIICTITAIIILTSNYYNINLNNVNGIELILASLKANFGFFGEYSLLLITSLFAFSTIISCYCFSESYFKYLYPNFDNKKNILLKIIVLLVIAIGGLINSTILWNITDVFIAFLIIINVISIIKLEKILI